MKPSLSSSVLQSARQVLYWGPLVALPLMLTLRWSWLLAPNEEPKWAVLTLLGLVLAMAGILILQARCRSPHNGVTGASVTSWPGSLLAIYLAGLAYGITYATNPEEAVNRWVFWCASAVTFWAVIWAVRHDPAGYPQRMQQWLVASTLIFSVFFLYGWFTDVRYGAGSWPTRFSPIGHQNFTGDVMVVLVPLLVMVITTTESRWLKGGALLSTLTCLFVLMAGGEKAAIVGLSLGLAVIGVPLIRTIGGKGWAAIKSRFHRPQLTDRRVWLGGVIVLAIGWGIYPELSRFGNPLTNSDWAPSEVTTTGPRPPLADMWLKLAPWIGARAPMWATTAGMVADAPGRGFGTGSFVYVYPKYSDAYPGFRDPENLGTTAKTNPHNAFLQMAAENGLPLAMLFSGLFLWLVVRLIRQAWHKPDGLWLTGAWAGVATGFDALFNHVFFNPASVFMVALGFGYWYGHLPAPRRRGWPLPCGLFKIPGMSLGLIALTVWLTLFPLRWIMSEYWVVQAMSLVETQPPASPALQEEAWKTALDWSPSNISALYGLALLHYRQQQWPAAANYFEAFLQRAPYHSEGLHLLGAIRWQQGDLGTAEKLLQRALAVDPEIDAIRKNLQAIQGLRQQTGGADQQGAPNP